MAVQPGLRERLNLHRLRCASPALLLVGAFVAGQVLYRGAAGIAHFINPPVLVVAEGDIDFGTIAAGLKVTRSVAVSNMGKSTLQIDNVRSGCGCTEVFLEQSRVVAGESTVLHITVTGREVASDDAVNLVLFSNDPVSPATRLKVRFGSVSDVIVSPAQIDFGNVSRSDLPARAECRICVRNGSMTALAIDNPAVTASDPFLTAKVAESPEASAGRTFVVTVEIPEEIPSGEIYSKVSIADQRSTAALQLDVVGNVKGAFYAVPVMLDLGKLSPESNPVVEKVLLKQRAGEESQSVVIQKAELSDSLAPFMEVTPFMESRQQGVSLKLSPGKYCGVWSDREVCGYVRIWCEVAGKHGVQEWVNVPLRMALRMARIHE